MDTECIDYCFNQLHTEICPICRDETITNCYGTLKGYAYGERNGGKRKTNRKSKKIDNKKKMNKRRKTMRRKKI
jgi:hypothetical protein